jgi:predicted GIY-YIG superfamily endonuclease
MFWVYILQNLAGHFYIGHTDNLVQRVANHNRTDKISGKFTRKNGSWTGVVRRAFQSFEREANWARNQGVEIGAEIGLRRVKG